MRRFKEAEMLIDDIFDYLLTSNGTIAFNFNFSRFCVVINELKKSQITESIKSWGCLFEPKNGNIHVACKI